MCMFKQGYRGCFVKQSKFDWELILSKLPTLGVGVQIYVETNISPSQVMAITRNIFLELKNKDTLMGL